MLTNHFYPLSKPVIPMICEYKDTENSQKNGKIWINKVSVWY